MTFLEFVITKHIGPRARQGSNEGESWWCCPFHLDDTASFHTMPHKPEYKHRFFCFGCGKRGDAADLLKELYPTRDWGWRRSEIEVLELRFEKEEKMSGQQKTTGIGIIFRGSSGNQAAEKIRAGLRQEKSDRLAVELAWADLGAFDRAILAEAGRIGKRLRGTEAECTLQGLAGYSLQFEEWKAETDQQHLDDCDDADCPAVVCRRARGLPPLSRAEQETAAAN